MAKLQIRGPNVPGTHEILPAEALAFLGELHEKFNSTRLELLSNRKRRASEIAQGKLPGFLPETAKIRESDWRVANAPHDLNDRRVEITGPAEAKMTINALNSGANVFMADFEDSLSPTWPNIIAGQTTCVDAVRKRLTFKSPEGKEYKLGDRLATLVVRPRGWHLEEAHLVDEKGGRLSASLVDFGLYFFHNASELLIRGSGPYFYLPKMESHLEARLWNDVFVYAQERLGIPRGTIRATCLIETIMAAFEMDEFLFELREHAAGLNAGRWDYIFSFIKKLGADPAYQMPDRSKITMTVPFMRAYTELLVKTCHRRGAHAMGGMSAFIPSRKDAEVNERALTQVRADKERESTDGFDGTWVAHPDLVPVAKEIFDKKLGSKPNQKDRLRDEVRADASALLNPKIEGGRVTESGVRVNIDIALQYLDSWLRGIGAAAIHNLMEDAATAEISRAELWQWVRHGAKLENDQKLTAESYRRFRDDELQRLGGPTKGRLKDASEILDQLVLSPTFEEFLTIPAYSRII